jgi:hypothetical protein
MPSGSCYCGQAKIFYERAPIRLVCWMFVFATFPHTSVTGCLMSYLRSHMSTLQAAFKIFIECNMVSFQYKFEPSYVFVGAAG